MSTTDMLVALVALAPLAPGAFVLLWLAAGALLFLGGGNSRGSTRRPTSPHPRNPPPPKPGARVRHISDERRILDDIASVALGGACTCSGFRRDEASGLRACVACGRLALSARDPGRHWHPTTPHATALYRLHDAAEEALDPAD